MSQGSTARAVSDQLSEWITEGRLLSGARVSESALTQRMGVSRNTIREAFRLLAHDGLLVHEFNRGVFVPCVSSADVRDVYRLRQIIEPSAVRSLTRRDTHRLSGLRGVARDAEVARAESAWVRVGTANMSFHSGLVALVGSPRLDVTMRRLMAELRLTFSVIEDPQSLYEPYVRRNKALLELLMEGRFDEGADYLAEYLADSEGAILAAFEAQEQPA